MTARLDDHNAGRCSHTAKRRPWAVDVVIEFCDEARALAFERYLKSGSGVAFAKRSRGNAKRRLASHVQTCIALVKEDLGIKGEGELVQAFKSLTE